MDGANASRTLLPTHTAAATKPPAQADQKARGANRSTKVAGKLKVLPDQPDVPTQSQILSEPQRPPVPPQPAPTNPPNTAGSDDDDGEDDDTEEQEEQEEQDAEVSGGTSFLWSGCL